MNRKFRGISWEFSGTAGTLVYQQFRAEIVEYRNNNTQWFHWFIYDETPNMFTNGPAVTANGHANSISRACFMCETWIEGKR